MASKVVQSLTIKSSRKELTKQFCLKLKSLIQLETLKCNFEEQATLNLAITNLSRSLRYLKSITTVHIDVSRFYEIDKGSFHYLFASLRRLPKLRSLTITYSYCLCLDEYGREILQEIAVGLRRLRYLEKTKLTLDFSLNYFQSLSEILASSFQNISSITELELKVSN
jgi:hypothetical protein